jgi:hypothetical protein
MLPRAATLLALGLDDELAQFSSPTISSRAEVIRVARRIVASV